MIHSRDTLGDIERSLSSSHDLRRPESVVTKLFVFLHGREKNGRAEIFARLQSPNDFMQKRTRELRFLSRFPELETLTFFFIKDRDPFFRPSYKR